ncbi:peptide chain release factor N(5)-glutamine methyltransferase [Thalassotalea ponticola]|uniref:peptide chain release factor N(5)-glutamine methyltransferase n=1 Tax=Thalassotalea ponticola TaxID=1523392 RepID=UPI0025B5842C|nr:peptide chain release factor N(5)-glutamine methyltransferase [Thalassotalea ponticola]MDN3651567.1 peptide chain release factor N(5)-glutamine methyltransferase [Thalassotalea ponticola]
MADSVEQLNTIEQLWRYGQSCFLSFSDKYDAKVDAQVLLSETIDKPLSYLITWPEKTLSDKQKQRFLSFVERRCNGEPVAFIIGKRSFWSIELSVADCTLIPRPDTETLVEAVLQHHPSSLQRVLDLGTGTGAIALALAHDNPHWQVEAVDFNPDAVALAQQNAEALDLQRVNIYQSDWFSRVADDKRFDIIVSNPPYIDANDPHLTQGDVRFEPSSALVADEQGFADIRLIIEQSRRYLASAGSLYIEHGFEQHIGVQKLLLDHGYQHIETFVDYGNNPRITKGVFNP